MICPTCHEEAELTTEDYGIGSYEFWGAKCFDTDIRTSTVCCETEVDPPDESGDCGDWLYERERAKQL